MDGMAKLPFSQEALESIINSALKQSLAQPAPHNGEEGDVRFMSFLKDTVLNSFDGDSFPDDLDLDALLRSASGTSSLYADLDRSASAAAEAAAAAAAAAVAAADAEREAEAEDAAMADAEAAPAEAEPAAAGERPSRKRARSPDAPPERPEAADAAAPPDNDTASVDTLPMPTRRRRLDADEVTSTGGANDLVEPGAGGGATSSAAAGAGGSSRRAAARRGSGAAPEGALNNVAATAAAVAAAEAEGVFKAVLVAKVLTKSDASSKRIILPRIAIEANLPELTGPGARTAMPFDALDRSGREWPLCVKAWANGANPKPVYVLEGRVGDLMKSARLGPGDVVGVLADREGRYYVHWNTPQVREAAARPTFCAFEFERHQQQQDAAKAAKETRDAAPAADTGGGGKPAGGADAPSTSAPAAAAQEAAAGAAAKPAGAAAAGATAAAAAAAAAPRAAAAEPARAVTAVPIAATPLAPGMPMSPCEVLVMGPPAPVVPADSAADAAASAAAGGAAAGRSYLRLDSSSSSVVEWTAPAASGARATRASKAAAPTLSATGSAVGGGEHAGARDDDGPEPVAERVGAIVHAGGALLCPRTAGCTRPAGHQGWCVGRKAAKDKEEKEKRKK
ncbi:hypothetical protein Rsub_10625 [Raphidocelis subcapitata]|uniref:TF-B3 domain-containing protein n=1 Tax=Raphidocelis subcapitata TaxID=307507 RepID=A0A2V0PG14_9CHLO|nr:hypothetical protein Rsub_10625 [Raphidocelis subcapitata]|eukprot:GBF97952.1 hypothetical protein Rsub_10625 [Raphidocelis subcapitata]